MSVAQYNKLLDLFKKENVSDSKSISKKHSNKASKSARILNNRKASSTANGAAVHLDPSARIDSSCKYFKTKDDHFVDNQNVFSTRDTISEQIETQYHSSEEEFDRKLPESETRKIRKKRRLASEQVNTELNFDMDRIAIDFSRKSKDPWFNFYQQTLDFKTIINYSYNNSNESMEFEESQMDIIENASFFKECKFKEIADTGLGKLLGSSSKPIHLASISMEDESLDNLYVERDLCCLWNNYQKSKNIESELSESIQKIIFPIINQYYDFYFPYRNLSNTKELQDILCLHVANHLLKSKRYQWYNDAKIKIFGEDRYSVRDQGFFRSRILILVPFRSTALHYVQTLCRIIPNIYEIEKKEAFELTFGDIVERESTMKNKPKWYKDIFEGNVDDNFSFGIRLHRSGKLELLSDLNNSDIIIGSPLGIYQDHSEEKEAAESVELNESEKEPAKNNYLELLSSIELCVVDQADVLFMQNWDNVLEVFQMLNVKPQMLEKLNVDLARVRDYIPWGYASSFRQTIITSSLMNPDINNLFNKQELCNNLNGKIRMKQEIGGVLQNLPKPCVPLIFEKVDTLLSSEKKIPSSVEEADNLKYRYFVNEIYDRMKKSLDGIFMIITPTYNDLVRIRNCLHEDRQASFLALSENDTNTAKLLDRFKEKKNSILIYTERHFYFYAPQLKTFYVNQFIFYGVPQYAFTFESIVSRSCRVASKFHPASKVLTLFSSLDILNLERIVGTKRAQSLLQSSKTTHILEINQ